MLKNGSTEQGVDLVEIMLCYFSLSDLICYMPEWRLALYMVKAMVHGQEPVQSDGSRGVGCHQVRGFPHLSMDDSLAVFRKNSRKGRTGREETATVLFSCPMSGKRWPFCGTRLLFVVQVVLVRCRDQICKDKLVRVQVPAAEPLLCHCCGLL